MWPIRLRWSPALSTRGACTSHKHPTPQHPKRIHSYATMCSREYHKCILSANPSRAYSAVDAILGFSQNPKSESLSSSPETARPDEAPLPDPQPPILFISSPHSPIIRVHHHSQSQLDALPDCDSRKNNHPYHIQCAEPATSRKFSSELSKHNPHHHRTSCHNALTPFSTKRMRIPPKKDHRVHRYRTSLRRPAHAALPAREEAAG